MTEQETQVQLEIGHVLFIDIVGYSKLLTNEQREKLSELNRIVRETETFRVAEAGNKLLRLPTGDGMVLAFFTSPDAPLRCAMAISRELHGRTDLPLRMGIHSGPVEQISDVNDRPNLAGAGVNMAQRVMDCGDAGHILLSARAADDLAQYAEWKTNLHYLGDIEVKHGVEVRVASFYKDEIGNPTPPQKVQRASAARRRRNVVVAAATIAAVLVAAAGYLAYRHQLNTRARAAAEAAAEREKSVAVLPFENLTNEDKDGVFAGGVHREVLSNLAKIADLKVISRASVMRYKPGTDRNVKQIAGELGVNYIVEGTVQRDASHVHVTVELINARTDTQAWAETYDGNVGEVLAFQTEIAERVTNQLGAKLSPREGAELASEPTKDVAAFESYIRARAVMESVADNDEVGDHGQFVENQHQAVQLLLQAIARDPNFLLAYCWLAEANIQLFRGDNTKPEYRAGAEAALKQAERIGPEAGETLYVKSHFIYYMETDFHGALAMLERAAKLLPNNSDVTFTRGLLYRRFGRWQEAFAQFARTSELNPSDPQAYGLMAFTAAGLRWWDEADRRRARLVARFPRFIQPAKQMTMVTLRLRGEVEAGNKLMDELHLTVKDGFAGLFYRALWKRDYAECRRLIDGAAKYPELQDERWEKEARLAYVTKDFRSRDEAIAAENAVEARLQANVNDPSNADTVAVLVALKLIIGKKDEMLRLAEEDVAKHPISEDVLGNMDRLELLAYACIYAGNHERAIQTLTELVHIPSVSFGYGRMKYDPVLDELRSDPRFAQLLEESAKPFPRL